jgi:TRAP-type C4-dicarboxylate transport system substrate-binding protein
MIRPWLQWFRARAAAFAIMFGVAPAACAATAAAPAATADVPPTEWRLAHYLPADHFFAAWLADWARGIERESGGRLRITIAPNNELLRLGAIAPGVRDAKAELGFGPAPDAPEFAALGLPFLAASAEDGTRLVDVLAREGAFGTALAGLEVVFQQTNAPSVVHTRTADVRTPEQLVGLRMRGATPYIRSLLAALGATPIEGFLAPQVYAALQEGKIDGTVFPYEAMGVFRLGEQLRVHTEVPLFVSVLGLYMNPAAYAALPAEVRAVVDRHRGPGVARTAAAAWDAEEARGQTIVDRLGTRRLQPSSAELEAWRARLAPFTAQRLEQLGPAARRVHARAVEIGSAKPAERP